MTKFSTPLDWVMAVWATLLIIRDEHGVPLWKGALEFFKKVRSPLG